MKNRYKFTVPLAIQPCSATPLFCCKAFSGPTAHLRRSTIPKGSCPASLALQPSLHSGPARVGPLCTPSQRARWDILRPWHPCGAVQKPAGERGVALITHPYPPPPQVDAPADPGRVKERSRKVIIFIFIFLYWCRFYIFILKFYRFCFAAILSYHKTLWYEAIFMVVKNKYSLLVE